MNLPMKNAVLLLFLALCLAKVGQTQPLSEKRQRIDIPFELENDLIVIKITFNQMLPLRFIFDTGAEFTILTKREFSDLLGIEYSREVNIMGADMSTPLKAYLARNIQINMGKFSLPRHDMLVLQEDYFRFEEFTGVEVHGIIGANLFGSYVVKIDYQKRVLSLIHPIYFDRPNDEKYLSVPIEIYNNKPYLNTSVKLNGSDPAIRVRMLIDTGASIALLLHNNTHPQLRLPETTIPGNIGKGLGGIIEGSMGRIHQAQMGKYRLNNIVSNFQDINASLDTSYLNGRNGIIGNIALKRFHMIIDYPRERMYLRTNRYYKKRFRYDRSGMSLMAGGAQLNQFYVNRVIEGSPAYEAGIREGDRIIRINGIPASFYTLRGITRRFQGKIGKRMKVVLRRDGKKMKMRFRLRDLF